MKSTRILAALLLLSFAAVTSQAEETAPTPSPPPASPEEKSLQGYGVSAPGCVEWSDGCAVCARGGDGVAHCSTPGVACQASAIVCSKESGK
jgi:hypothetical protein